MKKLENKTFILIVLILAITILSSAFVSAIQQDTLINIQRGTTQTIQVTEIGSTISKVDVSFAKNVPTVSYVINEEKQAPKSSMANDNLYSYTSISFSEPEVVDKLTIKFQLPRKNALDINPVNVAFYGYTEGKGWDKFKHKSISTSNQYYLFDVEMGLFDSYAIGTEDAIEKEVEAAPVEQSGSEVETKPEVEPEVVIDNQPRQYVDDSAKPINYIGIIIIIVFIVIVIVGALLYVAGKHKAGPTKVVSISNSSLTLKVQELVNKQKTDGQIVNELLNQEFSLDSITTEMQKRGRMQEAKK